MKSSSLRNFLKHSTPASGVPFRKNLDPGCTCSHSASWQQSSSNALFCDPFQGRSSFQFIDITLHPQSEWRADFTRWAITSLTTNTARNSYQGEIWGSPATAAVGAGPTRPAGRDALREAGQKRRKNVTEESTIRQAAAEATGKVATAQVAAATPWLSRLPRNRRGSAFLPQASPPLRWRGRVPEGLDRRHNNGQRSAGRFQRRASLHCSEADRSERPASPPSEAGDRGVWSALSLAVFGRPRASRWKCMRGWRVAKTPLTGASMMIRINWGCNSTWSRWSSTGCSRDR